MRAEFNGDIFLGDLYDTTVEPLIVLALTTIALSHDAKSEIYPQDIIYYELVDTSSLGGGDRVRIYYRKDTIINVSMWEDWRNTKYRRWLHPLNSIPWYIMHEDVGTDYEDFPTIPWDTYSGQVFSLEIGPNLPDGNSPIEYGNNVIFNVANSTIAGSEFHNNTLRVLRESNIGFNCQNNSLQSIDTGIRGTSSGADHTFPPRLDNSPGKTGGRT